MRNKLDLKEPRCPQFSNINESIYSQNSFSRTHRNSMETKYPIEIKTKQKNILIKTVSYDEPTITVPELPEKP